MRIIVDAFGGDHAPDEIIKGAIKAADELSVDIVLCGDESKIKESAAKNGVSLEKIEIMHSSEVFDIHTEPQKLLREGKNTSMYVGMDALKNGKGDAFVSAGSTGALLVGATFITKRLKGVKRCALMPIMPAAHGPIVMLDAGANTECRAEMLVQFAIMGTCYAKNVLGIENPRVALINNGAEETKGRELEIEAYKLLSQAPVNFVGNIEARYLPLGGCDVAVTDGFTGNVALKLYEGMGKFISNELKTLFGGGVFSKLSALMVYKKIKALKKRMDYKEYGGAVFAGASKPIIKAHGSSDAKAIYNAIRQARDCVASDVVGNINEYIEVLSNNE